MKRLKNVLLSTTMIMMLSFASNATIITSSCTVDECVHCIDNFCVICDLHSGYCQIK